MKLPPHPRGLIADVVLDGAGVYLAAATPNLTIRVRLAGARVPGLPVVPMGVALTRGQIDASLWELIVERARSAIPNEILLAVVARQPRRRRAPGWHRGSIHTRRATA